MDKLVVKNKGFTLVEIIIAMAVIAILISAILPAFQGMQQEGDLSKANSELLTLKTAVISYKRHNGSYPTNITTDLSGATPKLINEILKDPFLTDALTTPNTYGYITGTDASFGEYFVIYTKSVDTVVDTAWSATNDQVEIAAGKDDLAVSNAPVVKL
ncbi:MAG: prepilin-type N-terminal cleavage/methylation domain-containing protein [Gammaproteobacteria bacterium]|nr:prepilin-type N-terminal cleavage/methylation domain-containing protein [Gammaproteobacteria bacterium]